MDNKIKTKIFVMNKFNYIPINKMTWFLQFQYNLYTQIIQILSIL